MHKNKKGDVWFWMISGAIAVSILVISIFIIGKGTSSAKSNLDMFQSCEGQKGKCKQNCSQGETAHFKTLGCGSGDYKDKLYCCIPET